MQSADPACRYSDMRHGYRSESLRRSQRMAMQRTASTAHMSTRLKPEIKKITANILSNEYALRTRVMYTPRPENPPSHSAITAPTIAQLGIARRGGSGRLFGTAAAAERLGTDQPGACSTSAQQRTARQHATGHHGGHRVLMHGYLLFNWGQRPRTLFKIPRPQPVDSPQVQPACNPQAQPACNPQAQPACNPRVQPACNPQAPPAGTRICDTAIAQSRSGVPRAWRCDERRQPPT